MPGSRDVWVMIVVYVLAGLYTFSVYLWFLARERTQNELRSVERLGLAIVLGTLLLAVLNNYLSALIGSKAAGFVVWLLPIASICVAAHQAGRRRLVKDLRTVLPRASVLAIVCFIVIIACLHKLFVWESLAKDGTLYPDLQWHVVRVVEQSFQSTPGFWPRSPIAFPDTLPFQSIVADSLVSATFRYLPISLHAFTYAQALFAWAIVLWTAVVLIAASGQATALIVLATTMLFVPVFVWGLGLDGFGYIIYVFFHANPNSLIARPVAFSFIFHIYQSFLRRTSPAGSAVLLIPPASILFKANLAPSFVFLQVVALFVWWTSRRPHGVLRFSVLIVTTWAIALVAMVVVGRPPISAIVHPSAKNLWTYAEVAVPGLGKAHSVGPMLRAGVTYVLLVLGVCSIATFLRTRVAGEHKRALFLEVGAPVGVLVIAMAWVLLGWWLIVPTPQAGQGDPMHVNFEVVVWLISVPLTISLTRVYNERGLGWWVRLPVVGAALALTAFMAWTLNTKAPNDGGLALHSDYSLATELQLRGALDSRIPEGHCFAYNRRFVIYSDSAGKFPADFVMGATGCPVLNGKRFREHLGNNEPEMLRGLPTIAVDSGPAFKVIDMDPCIVPPSPPTDFVVQVRGRFANLTWSEKDSAGSYLIEIGSRPGLADLETWIVGHEERQRTVTDARPGTYFVRVRAKNPCGLSEPSKEIRAVVQ